MPSRSSAADILAGAVEACFRGLRAPFRASQPFGELVVIGGALVLGAALVLGVPLVFGPNGYIDPYGYREYDEPETILQIALSCLAILGPVLIGASLITWALRQRR